ncbi:cobyrinate a,c-diamide synthase [Alicyclobacillus sacchari]|uniref:cobyrinate a,c-diamide synthase n=1 Tax=Alicyclobacillus sacchari TaxID=392010 RepID=UPI0023E93498|nr:cobyrinate a,c-diamide synthase [Alicyclobacillus sacchari]GMA55646.1 cobyrinate a,c-diamide synthase [Alicyclobacillus sacchari]
MNRPRLVVAGTHSGVGKTTISIALMRALSQTGLRVQGFKVGPDYIDPSYHAVATGRASYNLDSWMAAPDIVREIFDRASRSCDISIIEGVMGLFDGKDALSNTGSTAAVCTLLEAPVLLVIDAAASARSAAAVVHGFQTFDPKVKIAGVIANRVAGAGHFDLVRTAIESSCGVPVVGYLPPYADATLPERHLGLVPAAEQGSLDEWLDGLAANLIQTVDIAAVSRLAQAANLWIPQAPQVFLQAASAEKATIAIAHDEAFNFYYQENLDLLRFYGAKLLPFRPLDNETVPWAADGLYLGGGFPEVFLERLAKADQAFASLRSAVEAGIPVWAECGGMMLLADAIVDTSGNRFDMAGVLPVTVEMTERLAGFGYREFEMAPGSFLEDVGGRVRGHEFHYSRIMSAEASLPPYVIHQGEKRRLEGFSQGSVIAGYTHIYFPSHPEMAAQFVQRCADWRLAAGRS